MLSALERHPVERARVTQTNELCAVDLSDCLPAIGIVFAEYRGGAGGGNEDRLVAAAVALCQLDVLELGMHGERDIRHERPWSRRPDEYPPALSVAARRKVERDVDARVFYIAVALRHFVARKCCSASRAVRKDLVPADRKSTRLNSSHSQISY